MTIALTAWITKMKLKNDRAIVSIDMHPDDAKRLVAQSNGSEMAIAVMAEED